MVRQFPAKDPFTQNSAQDPKNLNNAAPYIGVVLSMLSLASDVASEVEEVNNEAKIREAKRDLINHFNNVAESVSIEISKSSAEAMDEIYGNVESMLSEMKISHEKELGISNEVIRQIAILRTECEDLLKQI